MSELNIIRISSNNELEKHLENIFKLNHIVIDVETTGLDPHTCYPILFQLGAPETNTAYIIDWFKVKLDPLKTFLEDGESWKYFHHHKFDYKWIMHHAGIIIDKNIIDTMVAELIILGGRQGKVSLAAIAKKYLNVDLDKTIRQEFINWKPGQPISEKAILYAADDVLVPYLCYQHQSKILRREGLERVARLEFKTSSALGDLEYNGVYLDVEMWKDLAETTGSKRNKLKTEIHNLISPYCNTDLFGNIIVNIDSNEQLLSILKRSGLNVTSTGKGALEDHKDNKIVSKVLEYRKWAKSNSTYGTSFLKHINPATQRIHPYFWPIVSTGRMSCKDPNLQNIIAPNEEDGLNFRAPFRAQLFGDEICTADYSGCELRVLAQMSREPILVNAFANDGDPHSEVASMLFGLPVSKKENKHLRTQAKTINFGMIYGMGYMSLAGRLGVHVNKSKDLIDGYFGIMPTMKKYLDESAESAIRDGVSITLSGRKRYYDIPTLDELEEKFESDPQFDGNVKKAAKDHKKKVLGHIRRCGKNGPIQGTNGDIIKLALVMIRKEIRENMWDVRQVNSVHDEVVTEGSSMEEFALKKVQLMEEAERHFLPDIPPKVDYSVEECWAKD